MLLHISVIDAPNDSKRENDAKKTPEFAQLSDAIAWTVKWLWKTIGKTDLYRTQLLTVELVLGGTDLLRSQVDSEASGRTK